MKFLLLIIALQVYSYILCFLFIVLNLSYGFFLLNLLLIIFILTKRRVSFLFFLFNNFCLFFVFVILAYLNFFLIHSIFLLILSLMFVSLINAFNIRQITLFKTVLVLFQILLLIIFFIGWTDIILCYLLYRLLFTILFLIFCKRIINGDVNKTCIVQLTSLLLYFQLF